MKASILHGLNEADKTELRGMYLHSLRLRKRLVELMENKRQAHFKAQTNRDNYAEANWAYAQADAMGYCRGLQEAISLLDDRAPEEEKRGRGRPKKNEYAPDPL